MQIRKIKKLITKKHIIGAAIVLLIIGLVVLGICVIAKLMTPSENESPNTEPSVTVSSPPVGNEEKPNIPGNQIKPSSEEGILFNNSPYFVDDLVIGDLGGSIITVDAVHSEINNSSPITYRIDKNFHDAFEINNKTGEIFLIKHVIDLPDNPLKPQPITITVVASDNILHNTTNVTIDKVNQLTVKIGEADTKCIAEIKTNSTENNFIIVTNLTIFATKFSLNASSGCIRTKNVQKQGSIYDYVYKEIYVENEGDILVLGVNGIFPNENGPFLTEQIFEWVENKTINIELKAFDSINHSNYSFNIDINDPKGRNMTDLFEIRDNELRGIGKLKNGQKYEIPIVIKNFGNSTRIGKSTIYLRYKLSEKNSIDGSDENAGTDENLSDGSGGYSDDEDGNTTPETLFDDTDDTDFE